MSQKVQSTTTINMLEDFSLYPGLRYRKLGEHSGEEFRDEYLIPALKKGGVVSINLDGTRGYGSSFLEEAFGGAVREGYPLNEKCLNLESDDSSLVNEIWEYIKEAKPKS